MMTPLPPQSPAVPTVAGQLFGVGSLGQTQPEAQSACGYVLAVRLRHVFPDVSSQQVTGCFQLVAESAQVCLPSGHRDNVECLGPENAADTHGFDAPVGEAASTGRSTGNDRGDANGR